MNYLSLVWFNHRLEDHRLFFLRNPGRTDPAHPHVGGGDPYLHGQKGWGVLPIFKKGGAPTTIPPPASSPPGSSVSGLPGLVRCTFDYQLYI